MSADTYRFLLLFVNRVSLFLDTPIEERMTEEEDEIAEEAVEILMSAGWISDPNRNR